MTGPEHYTEAERRLLMAWEDGRTPENSTHLVAEAQVHATLALAAATALSAPVVDADKQGFVLDEWNAWVDVAAVEQAADGNRPDNPDDERRRIYLDGTGQAWIDATEDDDGRQYLARVEMPMEDGELIDDVHNRTGSLREIGRTW